ncbi:hypothetical protein [Phenylobacterium sp.]
MPLPRFGLGRGVIPASSRPPPSSQTAGQPIGLLLILTKAN